MTETYHGQILEDGGLLVSGLPAGMLSKQQEITVTIRVFGKTQAHTSQNNSQKQKNALNRLYSGLASINDESVDFEFPRFNIGRELDL